MHIGKICNTQWHGERNHHLVCRVSKIHEVDFELLRQIFCLYSNGMALFQ